VPAVSSLDTTLTLEDVRLPACTGRPHFHMYSSATAGWVRWRLLGGNNRELGRGLLEYQDTDQCRTGLAQVLVELLYMVPAVVRVERRLWEWRLRVAGIDVVGSGHPFDRRPRCEEACARFVALATGAAICDVLTVIRFDSRTRRPSVFRPAATAPA